MAIETVGLTKNEKPELDASGSVLSVAAMWIVCQGKKTPRRTEGPDSICVLASSRHWFIGLGEIRTRLAGGGNIVRTGALQYFLCFLRPV